MVAFLFVVSSRVKFVRTPLTDKSGMHSPSERSVDASLRVRPLGSLFVCSIVKSGLRSDAIDGQIGNA